MKALPKDHRDMGELLEELISRVERLEKARILENASFEDGPIICYDSTTGLKRVEIGKLPNGKFGIRIYEPNGTTVNFEQSDT